jgi:hypothetical protein
MKCSRRCYRQSNWIASSYSEVEEQIEVDGPNSWMEEDIPDQADASKGSDSNISRVSHYAS